MIIGTPIAYQASIPAAHVKCILALPHHYQHIFQESCSIPLNRNNLFEAARVRGEAILMIDSDMTFILKDIERMEEDLKTYDIVTGVAVMGLPHWPAAVFDENLKTIPILGDDLFEVGACGAAFLGISKRVLDKLTEPFNEIDYSHGKKHGEDISFCLTARKAGFKIHCDPRIRVGHIKTIIKYYGER